MKQIAIWGSTGSIGRQTLDVITRHPDRFQVSVLTAHSSVKLLFEQSQKFRPQQVVVTGSVDRDSWEEKFTSLGVHVLWGREGLLESASGIETDLVVNALVGSVGLEATFKALNAGIPIALANKEVLVMAGELVMNLARSKGIEMYPVDSEHSAVFQCLQGEQPSAVRRILLTASGGPFLTRDLSDFDGVTVQEALNHPNWNMGKKVTIDSATMVNKGLEVIEARWLFDVSVEKIAVVIHPQSIIHSMVEFSDGSIKAQLGVPDMRIPIAYALDYPNRLDHDFGRADFTQTMKMDFQPPDLSRFPALRLAYEALEKGGTAPAVFNGADEAAVALFLSEKIRFSQISKMIEEALHQHHVIQNPDLEDILKADHWAKEFVRNKSGSH